MNLTICDRIEGNYLNRRKISHGIVPFLTFYHRRILDLAEVLMILQDVTMKK